MTTTTDGRTYVYGLFDADGYECKTLVGVFSTQGLAESAAMPIRAEAAENWAEFQRSLHGREFRHDNPRAITVEVLELDTTRHGLTLPSSPPAPPEVDIDTATGTADDKLPEDFVNAINAVIRGPEDA